MYTAWTVVQAAVTPMLHEMILCPKLMPLVLTERDGRPAVNGSYFSSINPVDGQCLQEKYSDKFSDCSFGLLGNLYACEGKSGKVIGIRRTCFVLEYQTDQNTTK